LWYHLLISKLFRTCSTTGAKNGSRTLGKSEGNPVSGLVDWHLYCVLWAFTTNKILCLYSRSTPPLYKTRRVDCWPKPSVVEWMTLISSPSWNFFGLLPGIWPHRLEDTTTNNSSVANKPDPTVNFQLSFELDHIYHLSTMGNFNTSCLATLHSLLNDPLPSGRASIWILELATEVEPHIMVAASRDLF
jgi:hypothetical protein